jgi:hypothetical protein
VSDGVSVAVGSGELDGVIVIVGVSVAVGVSVTVGVLEGVKANTVAVASSNNASAVRVAFGFGIRPSD